MSASARWAVALAPNPDETAEARRWVTASFAEAAGATPPFSFTYGGQSSAELLKSWEVTRKTTKLDDQRTQHAATYSDPKTGLAIRCIAVEYHDFPTVEWTLFFRNTGAADTPILADIPNMLIDSCASGGRRNDLETLRRAVPLLRSDYIMEPVGNQCHTYGIAFWMPYYGTGTGSGLINPYMLRSVMCPHFTACFDVRRKDLDYSLIRRIMGQWRQFAPYYFGDYYPLTPYSLENTVWMAWQFDCPEKGEGMVQAFRRAESVYERACFQLRGLDPDARYTLTDLDAAGTTETTGRELMETGLSISIKEQPSAVVLTYKRGPAK